MERIYTSLEGIWSPISSDYVAYGSFVEGIQFGKYLIKHTDHFENGVFEESIEEFCGYKLLAVVPMKTLRMLKLQSCVINLYNGDYIETSIQSMFKLFNQDTRNDIMKIVTSRGTRSFGASIVTLDSVYFDSDVVSFMFDGAKIPFTVIIDSELDIIVKQNHPNFGRNSDGDLLEIGNKYYI